MFDTSFILTTPFTRTLMADKPCAEEPTVNYTPYDLFCLETWLAPLFYPYGLTFPTIEMEQLMRVIVLPIQGDEAVSLPEEKIKQLQAKVDYYASEKRGRCLICDLSPLTSYSGKPINLPWVKSILPYLTIPAKYNPQLEEEGISVMLSDSPETPNSYNNTITYDSYIGVFDELASSLRTQLRDMYQQGYIFNASSIAKEWQLDKVDDLLYYSTWHDNRWVDDMYLFLWDRLQGEKSIFLPIQPSPIYRHLIAEVIDKPVFTDFKVRLEVSSLDEAREKVNLIQSLSNQLTGEVTLTRGEFLPKQRSDTRIRSEGHKRLNQVHYYFYDEKISSSRPERAKIDSETSK